MGIQSAEPQPIQDPSSKDIAPCSICGDLDCSGCAAKLPETVNLQKQAQALQQHLITPTKPGGKTRQPEQPSKLPSIPGYVITEEIGRGGMGIVFKARQRSLNRWVALKTMRSEFHNNSEEKLRFLAEAEAVARLQHPNIIQIYEIGESDGQSYFSLEYVEGGNLEQFLHGKPQTSEVSAEFVKQLAEAVQTAHESHILHRDLKPSNILLQPRHVDSSASDSNKTTFSEFGKELLSYQPKIADFGLAKFLEQEFGHTKTGEILGTPSYMAPEQASDIRGATHPAVDIYSLGAILYTLLTGRPPFVAANPLDVVRLTLECEPVAPRKLQPDVPRDLNTICLKCLQKKPEQRYRTAQDLVEDLSRFQQGQPISARPIGPLQRLGRRIRRNKVLSGLMLLIVLLLGVGGCAYGWYARNSMQELIDTNDRIHLLLQEAYRSEGHANKSETDLEKWEKALSYVKQAEILLEKHPSLTEQQQQVQNCRQRLEDGQSFARTKLQEQEEQRKEQQRIQSCQARLRALMARKRHLHFSSRIRHLHFQKIIKIFQELDIDVLKNSPKEVAAQIDAHPLRTDLYNALGHSVVSIEQRSQVIRFIEIFIHVEKDKRLHPVFVYLRDRDFVGFRNWVRKTRGTKDDLCRLMELNPPPPVGFSVLISEVLFKVGAEEEAIEILLARQKQSPQSLWMNNSLGFFYATMKPPKFYHAVRYFGIALALYPENPTIRSDLASALSQVGEHKEALYHFNKAIALANQQNEPNPIIYCNRGILLQNMGESEKAIADLKQALQMNPDYVFPYYSLIDAYYEQANYSQAEVECNNLLKLIPYDHPRHRHTLSLKSQCQILGKLAKKLPAVLDGTMKSRSGQEAMAYAQICYSKGWYFRAYTLSRKALANNPALREDRRGSWHRYNAACYACLAASRSQKDPYPCKDSQEEQLIKQALIWLEADLSSWKLQLEQSTKKDSRAILKALYEWKSDYSLRCLRHPKEIQSYPAEMQTRCRTLWASVEELLNQTRSINANS